MRRNRITAPPFFPCRLLPLEHHGARLEAQVHAAHAGDYDQREVAATKVWEGWLVCGLVAGRGIDAGGARNGWSAGRWRDGVYSVEVRLT